MELTWLTLAGFSLAGLTFTTSVGLLILIPVIALPVYHIVIGWTALNADKPMKGEGCCV